MPFQVWKLEKNERKGVRSTSHGFEVSKKKIAASLFIRSHLKQFGSCSQFLPFEEPPGARVVLLCHDSFIKITLPKLILALCKETDGN